MYVHYRLYSVQSIVYINFGHKNMNAVTTCVAHLAWLQLINSIDLIILTILIELDFLNEMIFKFNS